MLVSIGPKRCIRASECEVFHASHLHFAPSQRRTLTQTALLTQAFSLMLPHSTSFDYKLFWLVLQTTWRDFVEHQWQFLNWCIILLVLLLSKYLLPSLHAAVMLKLPEMPLCEPPRLANSAFAERVQVTFVVNQTKPATVIHSQNSLAEIHGEECT